MRQKFPDSQKEPFGPNQIAWLNEKYGNAHFRNAEDGALVKKREEQNAKN